MHCLQSVFFWLMVVMIYFHDFSRSFGGMDVFRYINPNDPCAPFGCTCDGLGWNPKMDVEELAFPFEKTILRLQPVVVPVGNRLNPCDKFCWDISASTCKLPVFRKRKSEIGHDSLEECPPNPLVSN